MDMVTCPRCNGKKYIFPSFPNKEMADISKNTISNLFICQNCNGNGSISKERSNWIEEGDIIKNRRIEKRITLQNASKITNLSLAILSAMERGVIKPDLSISYCEAWNPYKNRIFCFCLAFRLGEVSRTISNDLSHHSPSFCTLKNIFTFLKDFKLFPELH